MTRIYLRIRLIGLIFQIPGFYLLYITLLYLSSNWFKIFGWFVLPAALLFITIGIMLFFLKFKMKIAITLLGLSIILYALYILYGVYHNFNGQLSLTNQIPSLNIFLGIVLGIIGVITGLFILHTIYLSSDKIYFQSGKTS